MLLPPPAELASALATAYSGITGIVGDLDDPGLLLPSGCRGWSVADLLFHLTLDAQRALVAFASPADGVPDVDFVSYWRGFPGVDDPEDALAHGQWVRRSAAAFRRPSGIVGRWAETATAAAHAAATADPAGRISTQGHVLTVPDFVATLIAEAVIHHFDLIVSLPGAPEPAPEPVSVTLSTVAGLAGPEGLPDRWTHREAILKAAGREALTAADRRLLGSRAEQYPLIR